MKAIPSWKILCHAVPTDVALSYTRFSYIFHDSSSSGRGSKFNYRQHMVSLVNWNTNKYKPFGEETKRYIPNFHYTTGGRVAGLPNSASPEHDAASPQRLLAPSHPMLVPAHSPSLYFLEPPLHAAHDQPGQPSSGSIRRSRESFAETWRRRRSCAASRRGRRSSNSGRESRPVLKMEPDQARQVPCSPLLNQCSCWEPASRLA